MVLITKTSWKEKIYKEYIYFLLLLKKKKKTCTEALWTKRHHSSKEKIQNWDFSNLLTAILREPLNLKFERRKIVTEAFYSFFSFGGVYIDL